MGFWYKAPVVAGTFIMIGSHAFPSIMGEMFGIGATMSLVGLIGLIDLVGPDGLREAILKERARCGGEPDMTFQDMFDPHFPG